MVVFKWLQLNLKMDSAYKTGFLDTWYFIYLLTPSCSRGPSLNFQKSKLTDYHTVNPLTSVLGFVWGFFFISILL